MSADTSRLPYAVLAREELLERIQHAASRAASLLAYMDRCYSPGGEQACLEDARRAAREYRALMDALIARCART